MKNFLFALLLVGCSDGKIGSQPPALVVARPYETNIPRSYQGDSTALVILLHGFSATGFLQDAVFGMTAVSEEKGFLLAYPDGTTNSNGAKFWNATDACCDEDHSNVDDVAYLNAVIDDMERQYNVDPKRVFFTGHSNGGFMSYRMACDSAPRIAAIASLAGAMWNEVSKCHPAEPVAVLQAHGDIDSLVPYDGAPGVPSAKQTVADWAQFNGCDGELVDGETVDLDENIDGAETHTARYHCAHGAAELWTIVGADHVPHLRQPDWGEALWAFFTAHPKP